MIFHEMFITENKLLYHQSLTRKLLKDLSSTLKTVLNIVDTLSTASELFSILHSVY